MSWLKGYKIPFKEIPTQHALPKNCTFSESENIVILKEINRLLNLGVISKCVPVSGQFLSKIFAVPKPNGGTRLILNLKCLNKFIHTEHFKMEDIRTLCKLISKNDFMCTIDLKDAYFLIPVNNDDKRYLRFYFKNNIYEFNCLCFGLCTAPLTFTKILKPVISYLRSGGLKSVIYLDDIICIGETYKECLENCNKTVTLLECLGFCINKDKSNVQPKQVAEYLGFEINTKDMTLSVTNKKRSSIKLLIRKYLNISSCTIRDFAQLIGTLTACCPAVSYGFLYTKILEKQKCIELINHNNDFDSLININVECKKDLQWWHNCIKMAKNPIKNCQFEVEIYSDASGIGWGIFCDGQVANGFWTEEDKENHINHLELLAAFLGLQCFAKYLNSCQILLRIDNTTAIAYINRMGGIQFNNLNRLARDIWQWCEARKIWIFASYIKSKDNKEADLESRSINMDGEWELSPAVFLDIVRSFGNPSIDLFATRANTKCDRYLSWHRDPHAENIDAFTVNWKNYPLFYAFPPFALISKTIQKIKDDQAFGIIVFPMWPSQPWYPFIHAMVVSEIKLFRPSNQLLLSPSRILHPLHNSLSLGACILSGKR